jgi:protein-glutamine gamma-glutamyltransferase
MVWLKRRPGTEQPVLTVAVWPWLLAALALSLAPHALRLPLWLSMLWLAAAGGRWWLATRHRPVPNRWMLLVLTLALSIGLYLHYGTLLGRDAGVALLTAMCAMKILETERERDGRVLLVLGYLLLMANLLFSQEIPMVLFLVAALVLLVAAQLVLLRQGRPLPARVALAESGRLLAAAIPVMLILFVLFPRIPGPLWQLPDDARAGLTGLDDEMSPGSIDRLIQSDEVAFRVRFPERRPPPAQRYWRGPVLWRYDGRSWRADDELLRQNLPYEPLGESLRQRITLEPHGRRWLYALDRPGSLPPRAIFTSTYQLRRREPVEQRLQYDVDSYTEHRSGELSGFEQRRYLQLPREGNSRARALAARWRLEHDTPGAVVAAALRYLREQPFFYTLQPPLLDGPDQVDQFLFGTRRGFCEHYAGSFTVLMRAAGIPARVVLGYQGGEWNGDYLIVRQSDAHAWVEVWLAEQGGWVRVDPTAAIAPQRIEQGIYAAVENPEVLPFMARRGSEDQWLRDLALTWDSINNAWNLWVLAYGPERQREFLSGLGLGRIDWREMILGLTGLLSLVALAAFVHLAWRRRGVTDPAARIYRRMCARLARRGLPRKPGEGPLDYADRVAQARPELAETVGAISQSYARLRYRESDPAELRRLRRLARTVRV